MSKSGLNITQNSNGSGRAFLRYYRPDSDGRMEEVIADFFTLTELKKLHSLLGTHIAEVSSDT